MNIAFVHLMLASTTTSLANWISDVVLMDVTVNVRVQTAGIVGRLLGGGEFAASHFRVNLFGLGLQRIARIMRDGCVRFDFLVDPFNRIANLLR